MNVNVGIVLLDENGVIISRSNVRLGSHIQFGLPPQTWSRRQNQRQAIAMSRHNQQSLMSIPDYFMRDMSGADLVVDTRKIEATEDRRQIGFSVNANDITDKMTIKIVSVNGVELAENPVFIRVIAQSAPIQGRLRPIWEW